MSKRVDLSQATGRIQNLTKASFQPLVLDSEGPIAVEFMSYGCEYCRTLEPVLQRVAEMIGSKEKIFRVNIGRETELAVTYQVEATPTLMMFLDGKKVGEVQGPSPSIASVMTAVTDPFRSRL